MYLAKEHDCNVTGITISSTQFEMASKTSKELGLDSKTTFHRMDAEKMEFEPNTFNVVWISGNVTSKYFVKF